MKVASYGDALEGALGQVSPAAPEGTPLCRAAREAEEMAAAYISDGRAFLAAGDLMNALAAFAYASGWLGAALSLGLLAGEAAPSLPVLPEEASAIGGERVREKRARYRRMLDGALGALECSPDPGSPLHPAAAAVLGRAGALLGDGDLHASQGREGEALACYSEGHGWLDAGVRAGLFRVLHSRDLFTAGPL